MSSVSLFQLSTVLRLWGMFSSSVLAQNEPRKLGEIHQQTSQIRRRQITGRNSQLAQYSYLTKLSHR